MLQKLLLKQQSDGFHEKHVRSGLVVTKGNEARAPTMQSLEIKKTIENPLQQLKQRILPHPPIIESVSSHGKQGNRRGTEEW